MITPLKTKEGAIARSLSLALLLASCIHARPLVDHPTYTSPASRPSPSSPKPKKIRRLRCGPRPIGIDHLLERQLPRGPRGYKFRFVGFGTGYESASSVSSRMLLVPIYSRWDITNAPPSLVLQTDLRSYADLGVELYARWLEWRSNMAGFTLVVCLP